MKTKYKWKQVDFVSQRWMFFVIEDGFKNKNKKVSWKEEEKTFGGESFCKWEVPYPPPFWGKEEATWLRMMWGASRRTLSEVLGTISQIE